MKNIITMNKENLKLGIEIYITAYSSPPWNEEYPKDKIYNYFNKFLDRNYNLGWFLIHKTKPIGLILGTIIPTPLDDYFRIEDLCIYPNHQGVGNGSLFINLISKELTKLNVDSILLNTVENFPSHKFYLKNNFKEISTSKLLYLALEL